MGYTLWEEKKGAESLSKGRMAKKFPNFKSEINIWIQEARKTQSGSTHQPTKTHDNQIVQSRGQEENFESSREK